jgi:hypothetical protein
VPSRTVADLANDTVVRLSQVKNIVGIKEATGSVERVQDLMKRVRKDFLIFSGDDATCLSYMLLGGHGVISVTANVAPRLMHEMCAAARAGKAAEAIAINNQPAGPAQEPVPRKQSHPVKWALGRMGRIAEGIRLPLTPFTRAPSRNARRLRSRSGLHRLTKDHPHESFPASRPRRGAAARRRRMLDVQVRPTTRPPRPRPRSRSRCRRSSPRPRWTTATPFPIRVRRRRTRRTASARGGNAAAAATPAAAQVLPRFDSVRLERFQDQRWLVVKGDPEKIWPVCARVLDRQRLQADARIARDRAHGDGLVRGSLQDPAGHHPPHRGGA